jgi:hypothetical protein
MSTSLVNSLRFLPLLLLASLAFGQNAVPQPPVSYASVSQLNALLGNLEQAAQATVNDLNKARVDRWKTGSDTKRQAQGDVESLLRNLQDALPGLITESRNAPENLAVTFRLYHNVDALHDVLRTTAENAGAFGPKSEYQALADDAAALDRVRRSLAERLQNLATSKEAELGRLRAELKAAQAAPPPPPKKIVIDDEEKPKKPVRKKRPATPAKTAPADKPNPQQPPATQPSPK